MTGGGPATGPGRRVPRGLLGALVVYLLLPFPPLFLAGPLAGRLLLARPGSFREWVWIALALAIAIGAFGLLPDSVAQQLIRAGAVMFTGAFLAALLYRPGPAFSRAVWAMVASAAVVVGGAWAGGIAWETFRASVADQLHNGLAVLTRGAELAPDRLAALRDTMDAVAGVFPGLAALGALAGGPLAVAVAHYIAAPGTVPTPGAFREFRFNDHLIWGALATMALALARIPSPWSELVQNLLVVWAGVYIARGAAVLITIWQRWPFALRAGLCIVAVPLLHFALSGLLLSGLADTWLDFRRRLSPPDSKG